MTNLVTPVKIEAPELLSIEESKAVQIKKTFEPMVKMLESFESAYIEVVNEAKNGIDENLTKKAKRIRLDIGKIRIAAEKNRVEQKAEYLRAEKAIDRIKLDFNLLIKKVEGVQGEALEEIAAKIKTLLSDRIPSYEKLRKAYSLANGRGMKSEYIEDTLKNMPDDVNVKARIAESIESFLPQLR